MTAQLISKCIDSINIEIDFFDKELTLLKNRLYMTQNVIKSFYDNDYNEESGAEVKESLVENKNIIIKLKKEAEAYSKFEKLSQYLTNDIQFDFNEAQSLIEELIEYFEKKEAYENCALFQKLQSNLQNKD